MALVAAVAFSVDSFRQRLTVAKQTEGQITAWSQFSLLLNNSGRKLDALVKGIRAGKLLNDLNTDNPEMKEPVLKALQSAVYGKEGFRERNQLEHKDAVKSIAFSPDGQTLASASSDTTVKLWNLSGQLLHTLVDHEDLVKSIAFSPDGQTLASASSDKTVKLWNLSGQLLQTLQGHKDEVRSIAFSPDGQTLASASRDNTVILWNLADLTLDSLMRDACVLAGDYLKHNAPEGDRLLCDDIKEERDLKQQKRQSDAFFFSL